MKKNEIIHVPGEFATSEGALEAAKKLVDEIIRIEKEKKSGESKINQREKEE